MKNGLEVGQDGDKYWYFNGQLHREDGPAVEYPDGTKHWYLKGEYHREDGPAIEYADGGKSWYLNGKKYSEKEYEAEIQKHKFTENPNMRKESITKNISFKKLSLEIIE